jgi:hypothetical protein
MKNFKKISLLFTALIFLLPSCHKENIDKIPKNGLIAYYTFSNGYAYDLSGNDNNGIIHGALSVPDRFFKPNESFQFNDVDDYIKVDNPSFLDNDKGTFMAWVEFDDIDHIQYVASVGDTNSIENYISLIRLDPSSQTLGLYQREVGSANWVNGSTLISHDIYYHFALVSDGLSWSIYINGKKEALTIINGSNNGKWFKDLSSIDNFVIGNCIIKEPYIVPYMTGNIDEVLLYNRSLTEGEIKYIYNLEK